MNCQPPDSIDTSARRRVTDKTSTTAKRAWCEGRAALPATGPVMPVAGCHLRVGSKGWGRARDDAQF